MWKIKGKYPGCPAEIIDSCETYHEALRLLNEYRMAFGGEWVLTLVKGAD